MYSSDFNIISLIFLSDISPLTYLSDIFLWHISLTYFYLSQEEHLDEAKTVLWLRRVGNLLGEEYARELAAEYTQYTQPHSEREQKGMRKLKHHQIFTKEFNR